jgi:hypothetical protein
LLIGCGLLLRTFLRAQTNLVRQQLKWVVWGIGIAGTVFAVCYLPAWFSQPSAVSISLQYLAIAPLIFVPLTLGYSIVQYRLMDVDTVVRRSAAYIISTLSVALLFGSVMAGIYEFIAPQLESQTATFLIAAITMSALAMLFAPMKNWVQERIDRLFYGEKYDYRVTLQDFGRTLSSTTDLDPLLDSLMRRLKEVFSIERLAIFFEDKTQPSGFRVARVEGIAGELALPDDFIKTLRERSLDDGIARLDNAESEYEPGTTGSLAFPSKRRALSYFVPCAVRSRIVAVIGLGRTADGALLSSEDTELLRAISWLRRRRHRKRDLAGRTSTSRQRAGSPQRVQRKHHRIHQRRRDGHQPSWAHHQLERRARRIYGLKREQAISQRITEVFRNDVLKALRELMARSEWQKGEPVNIYKFRAHSAG